MRIRIVDIPIIVIAMAVGGVLTEGLIALLKRGIVDMREVPNWLAYTVFFAMLAFSLWVGNFLWKRILSFMARKD